MSKRIAIITARGGSKRIPHKNIKAFCGKPIIEYSIKAALESGMFDTVMVSTDDEQIAEIARAAGAEVPFMRSNEASNDYATTNDVLLEVLDCYDQLGIHFDVGCCIYPTAPFVTAKKLVDAVNKLEQTGADTVQPVVQFSFPPQRGLVMRDEYLKPSYPEMYLMRSQDLEPVFHDCGQFYIFNIEAFQRSRVVVGNKVVPLKMSELEVQDIDNETDWKLAELKYQMMISND